MLTTCQKSVVGASWYSRTLFSDVPLDPIKLCRCFCNCVPCTLLINLHILACSPSLQGVVEYQTRDWLKLCRVNSKLPFCVKHVCARQGHLWTVLCLVPVGGRCIKLSDHSSTPVVFVESTIQSHCDGSHMNYGSSQGANAGAKSC